MKLLLISYVLWSFFPRNIKLGFEILAPSYAFKEIENQRITKEELLVGSWIAFFDYTL